MTMQSFLSVQNLNAFYGDFQALFDVSFSLEVGQTIAIIGSNGAGKSTLLHALLGQVSKTTTAATFDGLDLNHAKTPEIVGHGISLVPEGRHLFKSCTVLENLELGASAKRSGDWNLSSILELFPELDQFLERNSMDISGGQQQMVAIGRALLANPSLILFDELSLGLAPVVINRIYDSIPAIKSKGTSLIIVEQDIYRAQEAADYVFCLLEGHIALEGPPDKLDDEMITRAYFGDAT